MRSALSAALLLLCPLAWADVYVSLGGGQARPTSAAGFSDVAKPGPFGGLEVIDQFSRWFGIGLQANYLSFNKKQLTSYNSTGDSSAKAGALDAILRITPFYKAGFSPYFFGGGGLNRFSMTQHQTPKPGWVWADTGTTETRSASVSSTGAAYTWGGGLEAVISQHGLTLGVEGRWDTFAISQSKFGANGASAFTLLGRIGYRFEK